jgi:acyl-CoA synthetase (AMP-forming)/AMP-acid ligase II
MALVLGEMLRRHAAVVPDKPAYVLRDVDGTRELVTYGQLDESANRFASALHERGVSSGDRVAVLMHNDTAWPIVFFGCLKLGAAVVPVNARYRADEVIAQLVASRPAALVLGPDFAEMVAEIGARVPHLDRLVGVGMAERGVTAFEELLAAGSAGEPGFPVDERDPHAVFYTSGTTGAPKGAVQTHRAYFLQSGQPVMSPRGTGEDDIGLTMFPFFHMSGWANSIVFWRHRATCVIVRRADAALICRSIEDEKVTQFYAIPEVLRAMCALPDLEQYDLTSLSNLCSGTSAMSTEDVEMICGRLGVEGIRIHYGSSEAGSVTVLSAEQSRIRPTSIGRPQVNVDVRVIDAGGDDVKPGDVGEIVVRSDYVLAGYFENPEETALALSDGWYHTGDLATLDDDGYLFVCGRLKEVIRSGGESIFPSELERAILELAAVRECSVVGIPDEQWGEAALAAVVLADGATLSPDELIAHCTMRLAPYKKPRHVMFVDELPKAGATQKVQKSLLRERFEAGPPG